EGPVEEAPTGVKRLGDENRFGASLGERVMERAQVKSDDLGGAGGFQRVGAAGNGSEAQVETLDQCRDRRALSQILHIGRRILSSGEVTVERGQVQMQVLAEVPDPGGTETLAGVVNTQVVTRGLNDGPGDFGPQPAPEVGTEDVDI